MIHNDYYIKDLNDFFWWLLNKVFKKTSGRKEIVEHFYDKYKKIDLMIKELNWEISSLEKELKDMETALEQMKDNHLENK